MIRRGSVEVASVSLHLGAPYSRSVPDIPSRARRWTAPYRMFSTRHSVARAWADIIMRYVSTGDRVARAAPDPRRPGPRSAPDIAQRAGRVVGGRYHSVVIAIRHPAHVRHNQHQQPWLELQSMLRVSERRGKRQRLPAEIA
eukprot:2909132-Rhodomonas_salina.1